MLSTGEKILLTLAGRLALFEILMHHTNTSLDFIVLDELAGNLDDATRLKFSDLIRNMLVDYFKQVFVISHVDLGGDFDKVFNIKKVGDVSTIV